MLRVLFSVLAVVAAVLAIVLEKPILYAAAAVLLLIALLLLVAALRRRHRAAQPLYVSPPAEAPDDLQALGIMEIRPKDRSRQPDGEAPESAEAPEASVPTPARPPKVYGAASEARPAVVEARPRAAAKARADAADGVGEPVLVPYLQALRAALDAQTVCLLKQEDFAPDYRIVAHVAEGKATYEGGSFSARTPLLTASMTEQPVTVRHVGEGGIPAGSLGYSVRPTAVRQVALAPVPRPTDPAAYFLLADTAEDERLSDPRARALLAQFARLLGALLEPPEADDDRQPERPRREIIAEEMDQARAQQLTLALAFVYLNRAEALADEGEGAVAAAERVLEARLRQAAPQARVVRFGELTYGVFYDGPVFEVEAWGARVQQDFALEAGPLEGGVSIGIALLQDRHLDPDDFRADATEALREAFESGTCTILE